MDWDAMIHEAFAQMGLCLVEEVCVFQYQDAPSSFVADTYMIVEPMEILPGIKMPMIRTAFSECTALWKGELMFFDGANLAFGCGVDVMTSDFCCN